MQSSEDRNREYELKIKERERDNQEAKEKLSVALARIGELEGKVVASPRAWSGLVFVRSLLFRLLLLSTTLYRQSLE